MDEHKFGKGGIKDTPDPRDYKYSQIASGAAPFDWKNYNYDIEAKIGVIPVKNQGSSSSCGGQAWASLSYILDQTNREEKSAKFIYAQTHVLGGGSAGRTNCDLCVSKGVSSEALCPSYLPDKTTSEDFLTNKSDIATLAYADATTNEEKSYWLVNTDIDTIAQAIRDNGAVVLGITGKNNGTWLTTYPTPPDKIDNTSWNHWVCAGKAKTIDGKKYIGILNSWGTAIGENGWQWLGEEYFTTPGAVWSCWAMVYNNNVKFTFTKTLHLGDKGADVQMLQTKLGVTADGKFGPKTEQAVKDFQAAHHLKVDGVVGPKTIAVLNQ